MKIPFKLLLSGFCLFGAGLFYAVSETSKPPPNVILIVSDQHQADTCGTYGSKVKQVNGSSPTPAIDRLAKEGVRFDSMYCASPLCAPSRAAYMTGMYPHTTSAIYHKFHNGPPGRNRYPGVLDGIPGMGKYFRDAGYHTAAIGKMHVHGELVDGWDMGFDVRELRFYTAFPGKHYSDFLSLDVNRRYREMKPYLDQKYSEIDPEKYAHAPADLTVKQNDANQYFLETLVRDGEEMFDEVVTNHSIKYIEERVSEDRPFYIHVGLEKPHRPWTIHRNYMNRFDPDQMPLPETVAEWKEKGLFPFVEKWTHTPLDGDKARNSIAAYYACGLQIDDCVDRIVEKCEELGILENTIVIYTSDHGESLFQHGLFEKHNMLDAAARVPFVIRAPWLLPQGSSVSYPANLIDLIPTLCEMVGEESPEGLEGESLLQVINGRSDPNRIVYSEFYQEGSCTRPSEYLPVRMGLNSTHKYIYTHGAEDQLYLRGAESEVELENLAFQSEFEADVALMRLCTLDGWEIDEYPMFNSNVSVTANGVSLTWENIGNGATYDVYRSASGDPRHAIRLAAAISRKSFVDTTANEGETFTYWVSGYFPYEKAYTDFQGISRLGDRLIMTDHYPRLLPISQAMEVEVTQGRQQQFVYAPLNGFEIEGQQWIHIGAKPERREDVIVLEGPLSLLTPRAFDAPCEVTAEFQYAGEGDKTAMLMLNYLTMQRHYRAGIDAGGNLVLIKQIGEWNPKRLVQQPAPSMKKGEWYKLSVRTHGGKFELYLNGKKIAETKDSEPYLEGRMGLSVSSESEEAKARNLSVKAIGKHI